MLRGIAMRPAASRRALAAVLALTLAPMLLPALAAAPPPEPVPPPAMSGPPPLAVGMRPDDMRGQARMADELSRGTRADADTFERALTTPAVRAELERVLKRQLPDDALRAMATQARAESDYWLNYRQGIARV